MVESFTIIPSDPDIFAGKSASVGIKSVNEQGLSFSSVHAHKDTGSTSLSIESKYRRRLIAARLHDGQKAEVMFTLW